MMSSSLSPKKNSAKEDLGLTMFNFHVDLVQESQNHLRFLHQLHASGTTLQRPSWRSLHRYVNCWLPLMAEFTASGQQQSQVEGINNNHRQQQQQLIPPSDVAWLWHCHRLAPMHYERYIRSHFGGVILEANPPFSCQEFHENDDEFKDNTATEESCNNTNSNISSTGKVAAFTKRAWLEMFPNQPFFLDECSESDDHFTGSTTTYMEENDKVGGFDVIGSTQRQKDFLYQVSGSCFQDVSFLKDGVNKYYQFLSLKSSTTTAKSLPLVPTFQIDLIWHTHILVSQEMYHKECLLIRGERFHHDDSMDDRTPGAILDRAFQYTAQMWKEKYGEDYVVPGAMYRGESPASYYDGNWQPMNIGMAKQLMAGSNSSGRRGTEWQVPKIGSSCFIPAKPKSKIKGVNSNPPLSGFIFCAKGTGGAGYYSMETRDAYKQLSNR
jgi:Glycine-rich domain-containing protein-like